MRIFSTEQTAVSGQVIQTVNVHTAEIKQEKKQKKPDKQETQEGEVKYNPYKELQTRDIQTSDNNEVQVLEMILKAYMNNPFIVNQFVIMPTSHLASLVKAMTNADNVEVHIDIDITCCGQATNYNIIDAIIIIKNEQRTDFQVAYNELYRKLNDYRISLKWTTDS